MNDDTVVQYPFEKWKKNQKNISNQLHLYAYAYGMIGQPLVKIIIRPHPHSTPIWFRITTEKDAHRFTIHVGLKL